MSQGKEAKKTSVLGEILKIQQRIIDRAKDKDVAKKSLKKLDYRFVCLYNAADLETEAGKLLAKAALQGWYDALVKLDSSIEDASLKVRLEQLNPNNSDLVRLEKGLFASDKTLGPIFDEMVLQEFERNSKKSKEIKFIGEMIEKLHPNFKHIKFNSDITDGDYGPYSWLYQLFRRHHFALEALENDNYSPVAISQYLNWLTQQNLDVKEEANKTFINNCVNFRVKNKDKTILQLAQESGKKEDREVLSKLGFSVKQQNNEKKDSSSRIPGSEDLSNVEVDQKGNLSITSFTRNRSSQQQVKQSEKSSLDEVRDDESFSESFSVSDGSSNQRNDSSQSQDTRDSKVEAIINGLLTEVFDKGNDQLKRSGQQQTLKFTDGVKKALKAKIEALQNNNELTSEEWLKLLSTKFTVLSPRNERLKGTLLDCMLLLKLDENFSLYKRLVSKVVSSLHKKLDLTKYKLYLNGSNLLHCVAQIGAVDEVEKLTKLGYQFENVFNDRGDSAISFAYYRDQSDSSRDGVIASIAGNNEDSILWRDPLEPLFSHTLGDQQEVKGETYSVDGYLNSRPLLFLKRFLADYYSPSRIRDKSDLNNPQILLSFYNRKLNLFYENEKAHGGSQDYYFDLLRRFFKTNAGEIIRKVTLKIANRLSLSDHYDRYLQENNNSFLLPLDSDNNTFLHYIAKHGEAKDIKYLCHDLGYDFFKPLSRKGESPILLAFGREDTKEVAAWLYDYYKNSKSNENVEIVKDGDYARSLHQLYMGNKSGIDNVNVAKLKQGILDSEDSFAYQHKPSRSVKIDGPIDQPARKIEPVTINTTQYALATKYNGQVKNYQAQVDSNNNENVFLQQQGEDETTYDIQVIELYLRHVDPTKVQHFKGDDRTMRLMQYAENALKQNGVNFVGSSTFNGVASNGSTPTRYFSPLFEKAVARLTESPKDDSNYKNPNESVSDSLTRKKTNTPRTQTRVSTENVDPDLNHRKITVRSRNRGNSLNSVVVGSGSSNSQSDQPKKDGQPLSPGRRNSI